MFSDPNDSQEEFDLLTRTVNNIERFVKNTNHTSPFVHVFSASNMKIPDNSPTKNWWEKQQRERREKEPQV